MDTDSETLLESENPACQAVNGRIVIARGATERGCVPRGAGSAAARRALKPVEYFRRGHSCEAAAAGLRHSRGPGAGSWTAAGSGAPRRFRAGDGPQKFAACTCGRKRRRRADADLPDSVWRFGWSINSPNSVRQMFFAGWTSKIAGRVENSACDFHAYRS